MTEPDSVEDTRVVHRKRDFVRRLVERFHRRISKVNRSQPWSAELSSDALQEFCGVTPHSCHFCRNFFAMDYAIHDLGEKAKLSKQRYGNHFLKGEELILNIDYLDLKLGAQKGCPLCELCQKEAEKLDRIPENLGIGLAHHYGTVKIHLLLPDDSEVPRHGVIHYQALVHECKLCSVL